MAPVVTATVEPTPEPRPTHAKVHISDSNGNVKTSGVLRFGPTAMLATAAGAGAGAAVATQVPPPLSSVITGGGGGPLRATARVYQPSPMVTRPAPVALNTAVSAARTSQSDQTSKHKPKTAGGGVVRAVAPSVAPGLPVIAVAPSPGPAVSYSQSVAHLKPIQPKPTILGEPTAPNPALEALRKEKERPKKRRKENGGVRTPESSPRGEGAPELPRPGVGAPVGVGAGAVLARVPRPDT